MTTSYGSQAALLISRDLYFTSMVSGAASLLGLEVQVVADAAAALERIAAEKFGCVFLDLADPGLDVAGLLARLPVDSHPPVVAFGSHVATARLQGARDAGCTEVLPRSRFSNSLPELLKKYCARPDE